jgi:DNA-binding transcriptional regulator YbjK
MPKGRSRHGARRSSGSEATRARIVDATLETIRTEGIVGASARAIARTGNFNQASIYYHFGSINDAVLAAVRHMSEERLSRYERRLGEVTALSELVAVAAELHSEDVSSGRIRVLSQVMAGAATDEGFAKELADAFDPWVAVVTRSLRQVLGASEVSAGLPIDDLAYAVSALFVGVELLGQVGAANGRPDRLFTAFEGVARLVEQVLSPGAAVAPEVQLPAAGAAAPLAGEAAAAAGPAEGMAVPPLS